MSFGSGGISHQRRNATLIRMAVLAMLILIAGSNVVAIGAVAFEGIDQVLTCSRLASILWAIIDVATDVETILRQRLEAAVTLALVVIKVIAHWIGLVNTSAMRTALVSSAVVLVQASGMRALRTISSARGLRFRRASHESVQ
jgi:hypothetical protein